MLLTDGVPNTVEELRVFESAILDVALTERIDLKTKMTLAVEEVSEDVLDFLLEDGRANDPQSASRRQIEVSDVVVTRQLKRWHALHTIELVYRDSLHNQLNTRYGEQFRDYRRLSNEARGQTFRFGIGVVNTPLPGAEQAEVTSVVGGLAEGLYYVQVAWVDTLGNEGAPGKMTALEVAAGNNPVISAGDPPVGAVGFNVYIGLDEESLTLQNATPVPAGFSFTVPDTGLIDGPAPGNGQDPDLWVTGARVLRRG